MRDPQPHLLEVAIAAAGLTQTELAKRLGKKSQSYISEVLRRARKGRQVPAEICPKLEKALGAPGLARRLRPDVFGPAKAAA